MLVHARVEHGRHFFSGKLNTIMTQILHVSITMTFSSLKYSLWKNCEIIRIQLNELGSSNIMIGTLCTRYALSYHNSD